MPNLFALTWRLLLVAALVFNPVAGAASMLVSDLAQVGAKMPPCHQMASKVASKADAVPCKQHGNCGSAACQFAACCAIGALDLSTPVREPQVFLATQAVPSLAMRQADAPPPARMIRPPIA
jgi:hypothetical protein